MQDNSINYTLADRIRPYVMGLSSVVLCFSIFMSVFTSYPLSLLGLIYGRKQAFLIMGFAISVCYLLVQFIFKDMFLFVFFLFNVVVSVGVIETFYRKIDPVKGILAIAFIIVSSCAVIATSFLISKGETPMEYLTTELNEHKNYLDDLRKNLQAQGKSNTAEVEKLLGNPDQLAKTIVEQLPSYVLLTALAITWINMFLLLSSSRVLLRQSKNCNIKKLLNFKMPEHFIWPVIILLAGSLFGEDLNPWVPSISLTLLKGIGVFYFIQGFGIYIEFLDLIKLKGFFRVLLIIMTIVTAGEVLAIIGLFDMFINFRKLMRKKINRGE